MRAIQFAACFFFGFKLAMILSLFLLTAPSRAAGVQEYSGI